MLVAGLAKRPDLNGLCAFATRFDEERGRYVVRVPHDSGKPGRSGGGTTNMLLKGDNLRALESDLARAFSAQCLDEHGRDVRDRVRTAEMGKPHDDLLSMPGVPLDLEHTGLKELPVGVGSLRLVTALLLGWNELVSLPRSVGSLNQLQMLDIDGNALCALPDTLGCLVCLESLYANKNQLTTLPESIGQLRSLIELRLADNRLQTLPASAGKLGKLRMLWLDRNEGLVEVPACVASMSALEELDLDGNDIVVPPPEVAGAGPIRAWLQERDAKAQKQAEADAMEVEYVVEPEGSMHSPLPEGFVGGAPAPHPAISGVQSNADGGEFIIDPRKWSMS